MCANWRKPLLKNENEKLKAAGKNVLCFTDGHDLFVDATDTLNSGKARYLSDYHVDPNVLVRRIYHNGMSHIVFNCPGALLQLRGYDSAKESGAIARHQNANAIAIASTIASATSDPNCQKGIAAHLKLKWRSKRRVSPSEKRTRKHQKTDQCRKPNCQKWIAARLK